MIENNSSLPLSVRLSQIILGIIAVFFILYIGQEIILPLLFALIIAILLNPFVNFLERKNCNRIVAIFITVFIALLSILALLYFIGSQAAMFTDALPQLKQKLVEIISPLSPRELQSLRLAFAGLTARESAETMACSERTVNFHLTNAMAKLQVDNKVAAVQSAILLGCL